VTAHVGLGHLIVLVPADVPIALHAKVRAGDITEDGRSLVNGADSVERVLRYGPPGDPQVEVEATVGAGQVEVRRG
jgi:predicted membrane protein